MLKEDEMVLLSLVQEYSAKELLTALVSVCRTHRDNLSDMGCREKAIEFAETAELLGEIRDVMVDAE
jgi:hypothetical protein